MLNTLKLACRRLAKSPGYSFVVMSTIAFGVGLATAMFAILDSVVLRPLPFPSSKELVAARVVVPSFAAMYPSLPVNLRFFLEWSACPALSKLALVDRGEMVLTGNGEAQKLNGALVSSSLLDTLGVAPALGQGFVPSDSEEAAAPKALIGEKLWRSRFSGDPEIVGKGITLNQRPYTIVGVLPPGFRIPSAGKIGDTPISQAPIDVLVPKRYSGSERTEVFGRFNYEVVGRLAPGQSLRQALAQMNVVAARLASESGEKMEAQAQLLPLQDSLVGDSRRGLVLLFCAVAAVLLIASLNLAVLALARAEQQLPQFEIRAALGAGRRILLREAVAESLVLSFLGFLGGLAVASSSLDLLLSFAPADLPRIDEIALHLPAFICAALLSGLCVLLFGMIPALRLARVRASSGAPGSRTSSASAASARLQNVFVAIEVGLGTVLLSLGLLFASSYLAVLGEDRGYQGSGVYSTTLQISMAKYAKDKDVQGFHARVLAELSAAPGVEAAAIASSLPMQGQTWVDSINTSDKPLSSDKAPTTNVRFISSDFFQVLRVPLSEGRSFTDNDQGRKVAIISRKLASVLWPGESALGRKLLQRGSEIEVIGVAGDTRLNADEAPVAILYLPHWEWPMTKTELIFRLAEGLPASGEQLRKLLKRVDADLPAPLLRSMEDLLQTSTSGRRFMMMLCDTFALAALGLAALGIYGVLSYRMAKRRKELGIRSALGALPSILFLFVVKQGMKPVVIGLVAGTAGALLGSQLFKSLFYANHSDDLGTLLVAPLLLCLIALIACLLPASKATRISPAEALRDE